MKRGFSLFVAASVASTFSVGACNDGGTTPEAATKQVSMTTQKATFAHAAGVVDHMDDEIDGAVEALLPAES